MEKLNVVVALTTRENDYQAEQAVAVVDPLFAIFAALLSVLCG